MTDSIKDRMAFHILENAYDRGVLKPGNLVIEATRAYAFRSKL